MFGRSVTDEVWSIGQQMRTHVFLTVKYNFSLGQINRDLLLTPGYNVVLTRAGTWMLVISPM